MHIHCVPSPSRWAFRVPTNCHPILTVLLLARSVIPEPDGQSPESHEQHEPEQWHTIDDGGKLTNGQQQCDWPVVDAGPVLAAVQQQP